MSDEIVTETFDLSVPFQKAALWHAIVGHRPMRMRSKSAMYTEGRRRICRGQETWKMFCAWVKFWRSR